MAVSQRHSHRSGTYQQAPSGRCALGDDCPTWPAWPSSRNPLRKKRDSREVSRVILSSHSTRRLHAHARTLFFLVVGELGAEAKASRERRVRPARAVAEELEQIVEHVVRVSVTGPLHDGFQFRLWRVLRGPLTCPGGCCCWPRAHSFAPRYFCLCDPAIALFSAAKPPQPLSRLFKNGAKPAFSLLDPAEERPIVLYLQVQRPPHKYESDSYKKLQLHREVQFG